MTEKEHPMPTETPTRHRKIVALMVVVAALLGGLVANLALSPGEAAGDGEPQVQQSATSTDEADHAEAPQTSSTAIQAPAPQVAGEPTANTAPATPAPAPQPGDDGPTEVIVVEPNEAPTGWFKVVRHGYILDLQGEATDADGEVVSFDVDWGDGTVETLTPDYDPEIEAYRLNADHSVDKDQVKGQTLEVTLTVHDDDGATFTDTASVQFPA